jgi:hypothetical protein
LVRVTLPAALRGITPVSVSGGVAVTTVINREQNNVIEAVLRMPPKLSSAKSATSEPIAESARRIDRIDEGEPGIDGRVDKRARARWRRGGGVSSAGKHNVTVSAERPKWPCLHLPERRIRQAYQGASRKDQGPHNDLPKQL